LQLACGLCARLAAAVPIRFISRNFSSRNREIASEPVPKPEFPDNSFFIFSVDKMKRFSYNVNIIAVIPKKQDKNE
jgi:hypothetical protein